tara:strand:+ start:2325 stop:2486 length:162 start_codon:yes stop_codon:yes gene_type:complete
MPKLNKIQTATFTVRMCRENVEALKVAAEQQGETLSQLVRSTLNKVFTLPLAS